jgi:hypothetical protein
MKVKIIIVLMLALCLMFVTSCAKTNEDYAVDNTKEAIAKMLKAPSTAEFPNDSEFDVTEIDTGLYRVTGYVDSENGFGAMVRTYYTIELQMADDMYMVTDLEILD